MKRSNSNSLAIALWLFVVDDVTIELAKVSAMPVLSFSVRSFDHSPLIGLANNGAHREREYNSWAKGGDKGRQRVQRVATISSKGRIFSPSFFLLLLARKHPN